MDSRVDKQVTTDTLIELAELVLKNNIFEFSDKTYKQIRGTAIGKKFAPPYAILFMAALKEKILNKVKKKPNVWWRFIDDIFFIWGHGEESCHPYHCKKGIPYSQTLRLNRVCSDNNNFDKRCNKLESWLLEKGYSAKMVRKQVLRAREHSRESLLEKVKSESNQDKLTFNIKYYPAFQNVRNILQELHILLTPDKEHKKVFQEIPILGFRNGKSLKDHLVRAKLPNVEITGSSESCGKRNCQVCDFICDTDTFSTKACSETFKIQSGVLSCNSQKVVYLLKCRICEETPYVGNAKTKFRARFNNYKNAHRSYRKKC